MTFHGESVAELRQAFKEAVGGYIELSNKLGRAPQKPYSGKLLLRIDPGLHARASLAARARGKSLNQWASDVLKQALHAGSAVGRQSRTPKNLQDR